MELTSSPKIFEKYKCDSPQNTIIKIEKGFNSLGLDIVYREKKVTSSDITLYSGYALIDFLGFTQNGKGATHLLSKASAYAETAERFSTGFMSMIMPFPKKTSEYGKALIDVMERKFLKGYEENTDHESTSFEKISTYFHKPINKKQYDFFKKEGTLNKLVDAYSITKNKTEKVPILFIESQSASNGLASGNTIEEAIAQASFEIFERYCANRIVSKKEVCPSIKKETIKDKKIESYIRMFGSLNIEVIIKDFSFGNKLPVIGVLFINNNFENEKNILKKNLYFYRLEIASHINLNEAIIRCFTEYLQNIDTKELLEREETDILYYYWVNILKKKFQGIEDEFKYFTRLYDYFGDLSFLIKGKELNFQSLNSILTDDSLKDVELIKKICIRNKWNILVIDSTHKIINFPTVRVIIPPISTDFDIFTKKFKGYANFTERFNEFYGIKDFYYYIKENEWITDKKKIKSLIENLEDYLSKELSYYSIYLTRENNFQQYINIIHILPFLYLSIDDKKEAKDYFKFLLKLKIKPPYDSSFFKNLFKTKYAPPIYQKYIKLLEDDDEYVNNFRMETNPFKYVQLEDHLHKKYINILRKINDSF
jgi:ribosomal protein S12 methylthiotransferase accessory factor